MTDRRGVGWELVLFGFLVGLAGLSAAMLTWQAVSPHSVRWGGIVIDRLSASLSLLVASVGVVTYRFSMRYLEGESGRGAFLTRLAGTVGAAYALVLANNLVAFVRRMDADGARSARAADPLRGSARGASSRTQEILDQPTRRRRVDWRRSC